MHVCHVNADMPSEMKFLTVSENLSMENKIKKDHVICKGIYNI